LSAPAESARIRRYHMNALEKSLKYKVPAPLRFFHRDLLADETAGMSKAARSVAAIRYFVENIPLHIEEGDLFAGYFGYVDSLPDGYDTWEQRRRERDARPVPETPRRIMNAKYVWNASGFDTCHVLIDYQTILSRGTRDYIREAQEHLGRFAPDSYEADYRRAIIDALTVGETLSFRFADLAAAQAAQAESAQAKARLEAIARTCRKVPMLPPDDFYEAVQAAFLLYVLTGIIDTTWVSLSFGSFDQFMYPYYQASKAAGMTDGEAEALLMELFAKLDCYGGQDSVLSVGGLHPDGSDATNELSYVISPA